MITMKSSKKTVLGGLAAGGFVMTLLATGFVNTATAEDDGQRLGQERRYEKAGKELRVPRGDDRAVISASQAALQAEKYNGQPQSRSGKNRRIELTRFSDNELQTQNADGTPRYLIQDRLAWTITTPDVAQVIYGGRNVTALDRAKAAEVACDFVQVVDASTGDYLEAFQAC